MSTSIQCCRESQREPASEASAQAVQEHAQPQHSEHVAQPNTGIPFGNAAVPTKDDLAHGQDFEEILLGTPERQPQGTSVALPQPLPAPLGEGLPGPLKKEKGVWGCADHHWPGSILACASISQYLTL